MGGDTQIVEAARAFVKATQGEVEAVLDGEILPVDAATDAVIASMTEEARSRDVKIQSLIARQRELADALATPGLELAELERWQAHRALSHRLSEGCAAVAVVHE